MRARVVYLAKITRETQQRQNLDESVKSGQNRSLTYTITPTLASTTSAEIQKSVTKEESGATPLTRIRDGRRATSHIV